MLILDLALNTKVLYNIPVQLELLASSQTPDSVYQLSDVKNSDWAYQAWQSF